MSYRYDVFLSYPREGVAGDWVRGVFAPELQRWLAQVRPHPSIFWDEANVETGDHWPSALGEALARSRILVAVWAVPCFTSRWCISKWRTFRRREEILGLTRGVGRGLFYPIRFWDGKYFHPDATAGVPQEFQWDDLGEFSTLTPGLRGSEPYMRFVDRIQKMCGILEDRICEAPPWQADWPLLIADPGVAPVIVKVDLTHG